MRKLRDIALVLMIVDLMLAISQLDAVNHVTDHAFAVRLMVVLLARTIIMFLLCGMVVNIVSKHIHEDGCHENESESEKENKNQ